MLNSAKIDTIFRIHDDDIINDIAMTQKIYSKTYGLNF